MGALTAKKNAFTFRSWEPKTFKELDETEIKPFFIRTEHLKVKRTRILPINYWIADKKRFSEPSKKQTFPLFAFNANNEFFIGYKLKETKNYHYLVSNNEGYKKILDKLFDKTISNISCFFSRKNPKFLPSKITFFNDILTNQKNFYRKSISNFEDLLKTKKILLLTNPRLESPALNAYLYKNSDEFTFTSLSTFSSNIIKEEIPLSNHFINKAINGFYDLTNTTIIRSALNIIPNINSYKTISLTPLYLNKNTIIFNKEEKTGELLNVFQKNRKVFQKTFLSSQYISGMTDISLQKNIFDNFLQKKISEKFFFRLFLLHSLLKKESQYSNLIYQIRNTDTKKENVISILFQTFKTI